ncbi:M20 aminoacylase family protein [Halocynthiibacter namhaensis]|uniref:M20 aminoacylase family protein n=1 Tax=Halocynthiibacter namhaensis TaxID=1290553 RepID=UPI0005793D59|nr:M20 aminoacylase family protein [Halocynthiibacter namhaensis]
MPPKNRFAELQSEITGWRRHLHENPELLFDCHETAAFVEARLKEFGVDSIETGVAQTGVVAVIKGKTNTTGKTIALRADMDALPILEDTGLEYASKTPGKMHACGHDGHTSMLLGAAKYLAETRNFDGTCVLLFQPAEEGGGGGKIMVDEGVMDKYNVDEVYGMHNWPGHEVGSFAIRTGAFFAAADQFHITVKGLGGHAAKPNECIDTTVIASHMVVALQTIASRNVDPVKQVVVSVTSFETESKAHNVIPETVTLRGTVRTLDTGVQDQVEARFKAICEGIATTFGGSVDVQYTRGYPVMVNAEEQTKFAADVARSVSGSCDDNAALIMGGEDFAFMSNARPGAYILVGNGTDGAMVHHPKYNFNDETLPAGCSWYAEIVEKGMPAA